MRRFLMSFIVMAVVLVASCSGSGSDSADSSVTVSQPVLSGTVAISSVDNNFRPLDVTVTKGSTVVWTNDGRAEHNIVAVDATPFHADAKAFPPGASYSWEASELGSFQYFCSIHGTATVGMYGSVTVVDP